MIQLIKSSFYQEHETKQKLAEFIVSAQILSMGEQCRSFEEKFAQKQRRKFAVYVSSGSMANLVLIQSLRNLGILKVGDRVGFSALTWPTNVMPLFQLGLIPVPIDCRLETLNVSPMELGKHLEHLDALFLTNVLGFSDDVSRIKSMCAQKNIVLIEDNCESLGSMVDGICLGNFGLASTFSFFVGHHLSTIEGGMICTDDEDLYHMLVMTRAHGWDRNLSKEKQDNLRKINGIDAFFSKYVFHDLAFNARPTEINGFLGCVQIDFWDEIVQKRANNFQLFVDVLNQNSDFIPLNVHHMDLVSNFAMPVVCRTKELSDAYKKLFLDMDVEIRPVIAGDMTKQIFYKKHAHTAMVCPNSELVHQNGFYFGNNPEMTTEELSQLTQLLRKK
ncbi:hypothetical protein A3E97_05375 [Candidatus Uhrbacteria bacterium RIFCSPHIGHO2_12_FULL_47_12]|uniref:DegT/DnrJ/EryC1/StrS aminotransferase n=1 Tax=Candidatus Uhrbacteria bacterium RIFCSPLOWO2_02_FULL_48_18 TaxID=1802408 RepID=A0A1F7VAG9_9BACT|nr:MAG: hypothetical protein A2839_03715 [Candidatus Uhrbacteria bacterium RIFCSPHIGHO2_01_FULL_47_10]OGL77198.1 MAG: hypothetical protein A3E97_05375 [Candidatus Uhrbacteria bacterium RIFCSPHIGHO2_12_FULL_47_12]OGL81864.1 MAG: hypothetical protein A3B20_02120 [Candidatus Uhrbacteria bacterium RIFCSPLOWO2_01_FULL_47_17]OGL87027.1 MAG: hypothetical protein A3I41_03710 [Candidatus Uhrbacteria bacterium RIFCSPLOWO2_02_FULL_48_18]OGL91679.1 MAG: hypothetical protein A3H12_02305 [Candidatus Uhrbacte